MLRVCDQQARLLGLYAPVPLDVHDDRLQSREDFDREIKEHLGRLDAADAAAMQAEADALAAGDRNRREEFNGDGP